MPSWHINLLSHSGKQIDSRKQDVTSSSHATIFIDGDTSNDDTWRFVDYSDETQARRDWISQFSKFTLISPITCTLHLSHAHFLSHIVIICDANRLTISL